MRARSSFAGRAARAFAGVWLAAAGLAFAQQLPTAVPQAAIQPATPPTTTTGTVTVTGTVCTAAGARVDGASVTVDAQTAPAARTDAEGRFSIALAGGVHVLHVSHPAYAAGTLEIRVGTPASLAAPPISVVLDALPRFAEDVTVAAVRANADAPMTTRELGRREIESLNAGQEMPFLLTQVPSLTQYSDSGSTTGYSTIFLRGIPQSRMNVTLDGVPLNEPEDSAFYFANFGDFANALGSLQVQRASAHRRWAPRRLSDRSTSPASTSPIGRRPTSG